MLKLRQAILATLVYADIFHYPLTEDEIWRYLIGAKSTLANFRKNLNLLIKQKKLTNTSGFYTLFNQKKFILMRIKRKPIAVTKLKIAQTYARWLGKIPTVRLIGISGALAMENVPKEDDIDFFIITAPHCIWITRLVITVISDVFNIRRRPGDSQFADKLCLNMFIDGKYLEFPDSEKDVYTAHEIVQLKIIINKHQTYERFLLANRWLEKFLPQAVVFSKDVEQLKSVWNIFVIPIELLVKQLQLIYMKRKRTTETIRPAMLKFHPQDVRSRVMKEFEKRIKVLR